jgi:4'-phosphopantetheinyl transferase
VDAIRPAADEVHLWWACCDTAPAEAASLLPDEERRRADRLRAQAARQRYVAARALTRVLLGRYTGVSPSNLRIGSGARGKPRLEHPTGHPMLHFNAAHSGSTAVVALAARELGVDVESLRPVPNLDRLARRFCSDSESAQLDALPAPRREAAFLVLWTCKEAYLKAIGSGIAMPLKQVEVALGPPRLVRISADPHAAADWILLHTVLPEPAACTVAIRGGSRRLCVREFRWTDQRPAS